jgi:hypothetical protein
VKALSEVLALAMVFLLWDEYPREGTTLVMMMIQQRSEVKSSLEL